MARDEYDFWVFDLDGTLVDIEPTYPDRILSTVGDRLGVSFADVDSLAFWYGMGRTRERWFRRHEVDPAVFWDTFHDTETARQRADATVLYDDAERFVGEYDGPVGLVTHCQEYLTWPILERLDIADWFDTVVCCSEELGWKPDPDPVQRALVDMNVAHNGHVGAMAGDNADDVGAAWNAGLDAVHVERHSYERRGRCVLGDHRVRSFSELY
jgi:phosphoglycolate phosphatase